MGETRDYLEFNGGPGRVWCELAQAWIIAGSCDCDDADEHAEWKDEEPEPEWI